MGYDRGELLSSLALILFVEGEADRQVLDELFGAELHRAGVGMIPIHGAARNQQKGVIDAEVLLRFTSTRCALLLDNLYSEEMRLMGANLNIARRRCSRAQLRDGPWRD